MSRPTEQAKTSKAALHRVAQVAEMLLDAITLELVEPQFGLRKRLADRLRACGYYPRTPRMTLVERVTLRDLGDLD